MNSEAPSRFIPAKYAPLLKGFVLLVGILWIIHLVPRIGGHSLWDDSYMFSRYAYNLSQEGKICWNQGEKAQFGPTSLLQTYSVWGLSLFFSTESTLPVFLSSFLPGILCLLGWWWMLSMGKIKNGNLIHVGGFLGLILMFTEPSLPDHFITGMDTTLAMLWMTGLLLAFNWNTTKIKKWNVIGAIMGVGFLIRPDLLVFSVVVPLVYYILERKADQKKEFKQWLLVSFSVLITILALTYEAFQSVLPLSFYAKSLPGYDWDLEHIYGAFSYASFAKFFLMTGILWLGIVLGFIRKKTANSTDTYTSAEIGLLVASVVYCLYFLFFVLQVMGMEERFYYPVFPALLWLGYRGWSIFLEGKTLDDFPRGHLWFKVGFAAIVLFAVFNIARLVRASIQYPHSIQQVGVFDVQEVYTHNFANRWVRLDEFCEEGVPIQIATTEVGIPAVLCRNATIIDLAALNESEFAHQGFSADLLFKKYSPDIIYLPHPHYLSRRKEILEHPVFKAEYEYVSNEELGTEFGYAIKRKSE